MFLSIKEAADLLGVSVQTLRNWDENGYFPADKTLGGHRRYDSQAVTDLIKGKRSSNSDKEYSIWEVSHICNLENLALKEGEKHPKSKDCGGFTKSQIGVLLKNQETAFDDATKKLNENIELFYELASSFSSPYLFETRVLSNVTDCLYYKSIRSDKIVFETETVCSMTWNENNNCFYPKKEIFKKIIRNIDCDCIQDVLNNAAHLESCNFEFINQSIDNVIKLIDEGTSFKEPKVVVYPPELIESHNGFVKLNDNLKKLGDDFNLNNYSVYVSRLIPENKILIGTKSKHGFFGYNFCPYMIMCEDQEQSKLMIRFGKKLFREGSKHYGVITVKE